MRNLLEKEILNIPVMSNDETLKYIKLYQSTKENLYRQKIIEGNLRLILKVLSRYTWDNKDDLFQEGVFGLSEAIERFDLSKSVSFSTYAFFWIDAKIKRAYKQGEIIKLPDYLYRINKKIKEVEDSSFESMSINDLSLKLNMSRQKIERVRMLFLGVLPISEAGLEDEKSVFDIPDPYSAFENQVINKILFEKIWYFMHIYLSIRELLIIKYRFGFIDGTAHTLKETSLFIGTLSAERVRQLEIKAIDTLRKALKITVKNKKDDINIKIYKKNYIDMCLYEILHLSHKELLTLIFSLKFTDSELEVMKKAFGKDLNQNLEKGSLTKAEFSKLYKCINILKASVIGNFFSSLNNINSFLAIEEETLTENFNYLPSVYQRVLLDYLKRNNLASSARKFRLEEKEIEKIISSSIGFIESNVEVGKSRR